MSLQRAMLELRVGRYPVLELVFSLLQGACAEFHLHG